MFRAPTEDSDSDNEPSAPTAPRAAWPQQPAAAHLQPSVAMQQQKQQPCSPLLILRTRSNPITASTPGSAAPRNNSSKSGLSRTPDNCQNRSNSWNEQQQQQQPRSNAFGFGVSPSQTAKRLLSGLLRPQPGNPAAATAVAQGQLTGDNPAPGTGTNAPHAAAQDTQQQQQGVQDGAEADVSGHLHGGGRSAAGDGTTATAEAGPAEKTAPHAAAAAADRRVMHDLQEWAEKLQRSTAGVKRPRTAGAAGADVAGAELADGTSAAAVAATKLGTAAGAAKFGGTAAAAAAAAAQGCDATPSAPPIMCMYDQQQQQRQQPGTPHLHQSQVSPSNAAAMDQATTTTAAAAAGAAITSSSHKRRLAEEPLNQQQQRRPRRETTQQQQEQWERHWPRFREQTAAAAAATEHIDLTGDSSNDEQQQQQQQAHKRHVTALDAAASNRKRQHVAAAEGTEASAAAAAAAAAGGTSDGDMPQAAYVVHKRRHSPDQQRQQQQQDADQHIEKLPRLKTTPQGTGAAAGAAVDPTNMDMDPSQQQQQYDPGPSGSSSSSAVMRALQQIYPPLAAVLCAVQQGGVPAVLNSPLGNAVSAIMSSPAGRELLSAFADLANDESALAAALQQQQQQGSAAALGRVRGVASTSSIGLSPTAAAATAAAAAAAAVPLGSPTVQQALHNLQAGLATSQAAAAAQVLSNLNLAFVTYQQGLQEGSQAGNPQQQQLVSDLQEKLHVTEQQLQNEQQQRSECEAAAAAAQQALHESKETLEHVTLCQICFERPRDTVLMPCMHFLYCAKCVRDSHCVEAAAAAAAARSGKCGSVLRCPACRAAVSGQVVVHLSPAGS